ncbi:hypothetical protein BD311DRAFT_619669, partial [Dichomitus squalens]
MAEDVAEREIDDETLPSPGSSIGQWVTFPAFGTPTKAQSFSAPTATRRSPRSAKSGGTPVLDARRRFRGLHGLLRSRGHVGATRVRLQCHHHRRSFCIPTR